MGKILFFMQVDWGWIKQRPHFIAEGLADCGWECDVAYIWQNKRNDLCENTTDKVELHPMHRLPCFGYRFPIINKLNDEIIKKKFHRIIRQVFPDVLWLTHPIQIAFVPSDFRGKIVYDCMDDHEGLCDVASIR